MRKIIALIILVLFGLLCFLPVAGQYVVYGEEYKVYPSSRVVIPDYVVRPDGTGNGYNVYRSDQVLIPKYHVKKNENGFSVFKSGELVVPLYRITEIPEIR